MTKKFKSIFALDEETRSKFEARLKEIGVTEFSRRSGLSKSLLYRAKAPNTKLQSDTINKIKRGITRDSVPIVRAARIAKPKRPKMSKNGSSANAVADKTLTVRLELKLGGDDAIRLVQRCSTFNMSPDEFMVRAIRKEIRESNR